MLPAVWAYRWQSHLKVLALEITGAGVPQVAHTVAYSLR